MHAQLQMGVSTMRAIILGATGMVGQSVLRECLLDDDVENVLSIGRNQLDQQHHKLMDIVQPNLLDLSRLEDVLSGYDACFFCLGVSSAGLTEERYRIITYDITISVAQTLSKLNPQMTFLYVTGSGTDSTEKGRVMWARVKGKTENDLLRLPFKAAYMFRPGIILPLNGIKSKTKLYQVIYDILKPLYPWLKRLTTVTTTEQCGRAMIKVARFGYSKPIIESNEINHI